MSVEVVKSRIGKEDIKWGTGKFTRQTGSSQNQQCSEVYAGHIPVRDSSGVFIAENVEAALTEIMTIVSLVNQKVEALAGS